MASELKRLLADGMVIEGALAEVRAGSAIHYQLTRKVQGRTQTDYVPLARKGDVEVWTRRWKEAKALLKVNPSLFRTERGEDWGQKFFCFRGRPPAEQPDAGEALRALRDFIRPFRDLLNPLLVGLLPDEKEERCVYSTITLFWTVVIGFIEHLHSRSPCAGCHANISSDLVRGFGVPPSWNLCLGTVPLAFAAGM